MTRPTKATTVRLLSHTQFPIETIYCAWRQSREDGPVPTPEQVRHSMCNDGLLPYPTIPGWTDQDTDHVREVFEKVVTMKIPIAECVDFVFELDHVSIALREQLVRHRVGHKFGAQIGADIIPDLSDSTFWTQTMRVKDMGTFYTDGEYLVPDSVRGNTDPMPGTNGKTVEDFYHEQLGWLQSAYRRLTEAGIPNEDARNVLPLGCQHRMVWKLNLASLMHVFSKRGCWIAQLGMWEPVIRGMVEELANRVDPVFRNLIDPPCIQGDKFAECVFKLENENRVKQEDPYPPCPLYMANHPDEAQRVALTVEGKPTPAWTLGDPPDGYPVPAGVQTVLGGPTPKDAQAWVDRTCAYTELWKRNPFSGERF